MSKRKQFKKGRYKMATTAIHLLGDISRDVADLCIVHFHDKKNYYGNWVLGFGFMDVKFPRKTTRYLTNEEKAKFSGKRVGIDGSWNYKLKIP
jgi:hypothetical protein